MTPPSLTAQFQIRADHPCLPGHFPQRPVVPAVVLLDRIVDALQAGAAPLRLDAIAAAKFVRAVMPGETVDVRYDIAPTSPLVYTFNCSVDGSPVASGRMRMHLPTSSVDQPPGESDLNPS